MGEKDNRSIVERDHQDIEHVQYLDASWWGVKPKAAYDVLNQYSKWVSRWVIEHREYCGWPYRSVTGKDDQVEIITRR